MKKPFALALLFFSSIALGSYEEHFPTYFQYCTGTKWRLQNGEEGGAPGHGIMYVHGLCKDYRSNYPQVIPCSEVSPELKKKYPHEGVGISVDAEFSNVMWIAVPGKGMMFDGNLERKVVSQTEIDNHIKEIRDWKVFTGVTSKSKKLYDIEFGSNEYLDILALDTLGTDHALNWARELHCVKAPAPASKLQDVASFLNESNSQYKEQQNYQWDKIKNNCVHLPIKVSHRLGMTKDIKTDQSLPRMLFNLSFPANVFFMYADTLVLKEEPSMRKLQKSVSSQGYHPVQIGTLFEHHEAFPANDYFNTNILSAFTAPRIPKVTKLLSTPEKYEKKYMTPENTDLKANAELWLRRYEKMLSKISSSDGDPKVEIYLLEQIELAKRIIAAE